MGKSQTKQKNVNDLLNPWLLVSVFTSPKKMQNVVPVALPSSKQAHQNSNSFGETEVKLPEKNIMVLFVIKAYVQNGQMLKSL